MPHRLCQRIIIRNRAGNALLDGDTGQQGGQISQSARIRQATQGQIIGHTHNGLRIVSDQRLQQLRQVALINGAQHGLYSLGAKIARAIGNSLVAQRQGIPHGAIGCLRQQTQGGQLELHFFLGQNVLQVTHNRGHCHLLQIELQTARQDRDRNLLRIGRGQNEFDVRWRLFQRLEHGVKGVPGQHVNFVNHVDLVTARAGGVDRLLQQLGHLFHTSVGGSVQLYIINKAARINLGTSAANATGLGSDASFAVQRLGQNTRQGGLAHAACARKQPGMVQALGIQGVRQSAHHVVLTNQGVKGTGAPLAGQNEIGHANSGRREPSIQISERKSVPDSVLKGSR